jgi:hypothetical protein
MEVNQFVARWLGSSAAERAHKDMYLTELTDVLGLPHPDVASDDPLEDRYVFERAVRFPGEDPSAPPKKIDLYKQGCFILEAKQGSEAAATRLGTARRGTPGWHVAMKDAFGQALGYARCFDPAPPFLVVADIGHCFDLYASFDGTWAYRPFPNPQASRLLLADLERHLPLLRTLFTHPLSLDPARQAVRVTRDVAAHLAGLAQSLQDAGHPREVVARFLMRCLFTMFAEDVGLLPRDLFTDAIEKLWLPNPAAFPGGIRSLWGAMNAGQDFGFMGRLLRFNGGLFAEPDPLSLNREQLGLLLEAASCQWSEVEPSIFGTLLERALDERKRHGLGAHFTPRAYVERLVRPTIEEPLRAEWDVVQAQVHQLVEAGREGEARAAVKDFHRRLCGLRVLDPACGSGNFLYVALHLFKQLEAEALSLLAGLGEAQELLHLETVRVTPEQFLGLEKDPWAREIAELVLWIGYLQWHFRTAGKAEHIQEPVLRDYRNIVCQDAVLAFDREELVTDVAGRPVTRWDGVTFKPHPVTGELVPDESARALQHRYVNPRKAEWPRADFLVGNPPFMGNKRMRAALGDGYVEALRQAWHDTPDTLDYVMYWWHHAAGLVASGEARRFGFITTNSITQTFNRGVVQAALGNGLRLSFAIPDHPWVESTTGAAVRIAMTVGTKDAAAGRMLTVTAEGEGPDDTVEVVLHEKVGQVHADLSVGADVCSAPGLRANEGIAFTGMYPLGQGFVVMPDDLDSAIGTDRDSERVVKAFVIAKDLTQTNRHARAIDFYPLGSDEARERFPCLFQHVMERVKPERDQNARESRKRKWWLFAEPVPALRAALVGLRRYIAVPRTAKHFSFQFVAPDVRPDTSVVAVATDDAFHLGILSTRIHLVWAVTAGGRLGVGNDPRYQHQRTFNPFPFPDPTEPQKARIRDLGERLDAFRKERQALHPDLTLTGMYNVLEALRAGRALSPKEKAIHEKGLVTVLRTLHDELDRAVAQAYGWPADLPDEEILTRLVALNAERAAEEREGKVRWLRPEFQGPSSAASLAGAGLVPAQQQVELDVGAVHEPPAAAGAAGPRPWPKDLPGRITAVLALLQSDGAAWSAQAVARSFQRARERDVTEVLKSLAAVARAVAVDTPEGRRWRAG